CRGRDQSWISWCVRKRMTWDVLLCVARPARLTPSRVGARPGHPISDICSAANRPNTFLPSYRVLLPKSGKALAVADDEGRNGVWLAEQGLDVLSLEGAYCAPYKGAPSVKTPPRSRPAARPAGCC